MIVSIVLIFLPGAIRFSGVIFTLVLTSSRNGRPENDRALSEMETNPALESNGITEINSGRHMHRSSTGFCRRVDCLVEGWRVDCLAISHRSKCPHIEDVARIPCHLRLGRESVRRTGEEWRHCGTCNSNSCELNKISSKYLHDDASPLLRLPGINPAFVSPL